MPGSGSRRSCVDGDTLAAPATPAGGGLRAVVRLTGPRAVELAGDCPGALVFRAPHTYTREDVVEVPLPGSPPLVDLFIRSLVEQGARLAKPGEFTLRAFLNGRIDLAQAEAVEGVISSEDAEDCRAALAQLEGRFSRRVGRAEAALLDLCADVEAAIDFTDQDIEIASAESVLARAGAARTDVESILAETGLRRVADERFTAVLCGPPNAGKSTLFNALTGSDAIVSDRAGTTRDVLSADLDVGARVRLLDVAGERAAEGADAEAVRRAREAVRSADAALFVVDAARWEEAVPLEPRGVSVLLVINKCDLASGEAARRGFGDREAVAVSARTGQGLEELKSALGRLAQRSGGLASARFRVNVRQWAALREAAAALGRAPAAADQGLEFLAIELRSALAALGALTGRDVGEDVLDRVFSRFCLGK